MEATEADAPALTLVSGGLCDTRSLRQWSQDSLTGEYDEYEVSIVPGQVWRLGQERYAIVSLGGMPNLDYILQALHQMRAEGKSSGRVIPLEPKGFEALAARWQAETGENPEHLYGGEA